MAKFKVLSRYLPEMTEKYHKKSQKRRSADPDLNQGSPVYANVVLKRWNGN